MDEDGNPIPPPPLVDPPHVTIRSAKWPDSYLRIQGEGLFTEDKAGLVVINCEDHIGRWSQLRMQPFSDGTVSIMSTGMAGSLILSVNPVDGKLGVKFGNHPATSTGPNEKFMRGTSGDAGTLESAKPGWFLRMDASGPHVGSDGYGVVSVQNGIGDDGKLLITDNGWN